MGKYFAYSADNGFEIFNTAAEAEEAAQRVIDMHREDAYVDGWDEDVETVCWGEISQKSSVVSIANTPDPETGTYQCDYNLCGVRGAAK